MSKEKSFIEKCLYGEALLEDIDDYVDFWHESDTEGELHDFLGMTEEEYSCWVGDPNTLPFIITAHKENKPLEIVMHEWESLPLAARSPYPQKVKKLMEWLKSEGLHD